MPVRARPHIPKFILNPVIELFKTHQPVPTMDTAHAQTQVSSAENQELSRTLFLKPGEVKI